LPHMKRRAKVSTKLTADELNNLRERVRREDPFLSGAKRVKVNVHTGTCGLASGAGKVLDVINQECAAAGADDVMVMTSGCLGMCSREPLVTIEVQGHEPVIYHNIDSEKARQIFREHVQGGVVQEVFAMARGSEQDERRHHA
jgi:NADP-reducing hydrogenase subunit HndB